MHISSVSLVLLISIITLLYAKNFINFFRNRFSASDSPFCDVHQILEGSLELRLFNYFLSCYSRLRAEQRNEVELMRKFV